MSEDLARRKWSIGREAALRRPRVTIHLADESADGAARPPYHGDGQATRFAHKVARHDGLSADP